MHQVLLIQSLLEGHSGCFQFWAIMSEAAINNHIQARWEHRFSFPLGKNLGLWVVDSVYVYVNFGKNLPNNFPHILSRQQRRRVLVLSHPCQHWYQQFTKFFLAILICVAWYLIVLLIFNVCFLMHNMEHIFMCLFTICISSLVKCLLRYFCPVFVRLLVCLLLNFESSLYLLNTSPLSAMWFVNIFS